MAKPSPEIAHRVAHMRGMAEQAWDRGCSSLHPHPRGAVPGGAGEKYKEPLAEAAPGQPVGQGQRRRPAPG